MNSGFNAFWRPTFIFNLGLAAGMLPAADKSHTTQVRLATATIDTRRGGGMNL